MNKKKWSPLYILILTLGLQACGGGGSDSGTSNNTADTTRPVITLSGESTVNLAAGESYSEAGAIAVDNKDGVIDVVISGSVGTGSGSYDITYTATDRAGNTASVTRTVIVAEDAGSTDGSSDGSADGSTDGSSNGGTAEYPGVEMIEAFGGSTINGDTFTFPTGAEPWAGFANMNTNIYPFTFANGGTITFTGAVAAGGDARVYFRFEKNPYPDTEPSFNLAPVVVSGEAEQQYRVTVPAQPSSRTYSSFLLYVVDRDTPVTVKNIVVTDDNGSTGTDRDTPSSGGGSSGGGIPVGDSSDGGDLLVFSNGVVAPMWDLGINAFDSAIGWSECNQDGGAGCPSIDWQLVSDTQRGDVLEVSHSSDGAAAGLFIKAGSTVNLSDYSNGAIQFDIKVVSGDSKITMKLDCGYPCTSGEQSLGSKGANGWETVSVSMSSLAAGGLDLAKVDTGLVIWATDATSTVFLLDNVRFTGIAAGATPPTEQNGSNLPPSSTDYTIIPYGAGSISDTINVASYRCAVDYGNWIYNAGVVEPAIDACDASTRIPTGTPRPLSPQLTGEALNRPVPTHKWWGSVGFVGEMRDGGAAYITPDPFRARISNRGARINGIPGGIVTRGNFPQYDGPDPFVEVFEGVAIANSAFNDMDAYLKDHSDGSVTVQWKSGSTAVMDATFAHGSPYIYFKVYQGNAILKTLRESYLIDGDGNSIPNPEKGTFYNQGNHLGVWTNVSGIRNNILITGEGPTTYSNIDGNEITINNSSKEFTLTYLPTITGEPSNSMTNFFAAKARNVVSAVNIGYSVDRDTNMVTVNHEYLDAQGNPADTIVGMHPLHWKNSDQATSSYKIRSARGMIKFAETDAFSYDLAFTGVLPTMPSISGTYDQATLESLVSDFVNGGENSWINATDTYWSGKAYGKVAEAAALAQSIGMEAEAGQLIDWLKAELSDWFTAETDGEIDILKYFAYDEEWDALFGIEEAYGSHQRMADHHFHYGYFVRAAAEICRVDVAWCGDDQYGPMIELLIRDYSGDDSEEMFPKTRNFDPANGFSWADGKGDAIQGNNNESTSEAANAYGAMVLYGLAVGKDDIIEKGMYMHASTSAAFWQYWNNIDGYNNLGSDYNNFPPGYDKITTSIIWGSGADFSTWFSCSREHILGIQGLPSNPLMLYVGQYAEYMKSYVELGLSESSNGKPSGLGPPPCFPADQRPYYQAWKDIWWNLWAMTDADAALADYNSVGTNYAPEAGESKAHTYHWLHTFKALGHLKTGAGELTADDPGAVAFDKDGVKTYVVYNYSNQPKTVTFSDGKTVNAAANGFTIDQ